MTNHKLIITPRTKIAELFQAYPELEDVLIDLAPAFNQLKNPALRDTIARVTSLQQAASLGEVPVSTIVNKLRGLVGQEALQNLADDSSSADEDPPAWFKAERIIKTMDAREMIATGGHPVGQVMGDLQGFETGAIYELITPFLPEPLLEKVRNMGFKCWTDKENGNLYRSYFCK